MRLQDLDEWHGLTRQMIVSHLNHTGWCSLIGNENMYLLKPAYVQLEVFGDFARTIGRLAEIEGRTPQALLRDINPRMRKGKPSLAELRACSYWLVHDIETGEVEMMAAIERTKYLESVLYSPDFPRWEYWPCDAAGNKVRWPSVATDAEKC